MSDAKISPGGAPEPLISPGGGPLPLAGCAIGITADRRWEEQADLLRRRGATIVHGPTLSTLDLSSHEPLQQVTAELIDEPPDYLVVTTGMGMRMWLEAADARDRAEALKAALSGARIVARGAKAASAVKGAGLPLWWRAPHETMDEIVRHLHGQGVAESRVALQLFEPGGHTSTDALRAMAGSLVEVPVYRWRMPRDPAPAVRLIEAATGGALEAVTFTSQPAVHQLFRIAGSMEGTTPDRLRHALNGKVLPACIGPVCAEAAREEGIQEPVWPEPPRLPGMVRQIVDLLRPARASPTGN